VKKLKEEEYYVLSVEQDENSADYKEVNTTGKEHIAFIIGNEVEGITKDVIEISDVTVEIPMLGTKESLNVTIAFGIAVYRILGV
jgi:tRNA G18 (ribose-2'-O)-methylase SpoU